MKLSDIVKGMDKTELLYLKETYAKTFQGRVLRVEFEGKKNVYLVLDKTIFHPKGGGQPTDKGHISEQNCEVNIKKALYVGGVVVHWGRMLQGRISEGPVFGEIDWERRYWYMKRHTAGHLLDHCLTVLTGKPVETTESWLENPCYVGYAGSPPSASCLESAEEMVNEMISKDAAVNIESISYKGLLEIAPDAPNIYRLPVLETYRIVTIDGCNPIPCAGTHLKNIGEIGRLTVKKIETHGSDFRVYYDVQ
ncbi:MAG: alanyl-tRNA editing protein [Candidatus Bathyarchaeia archaeon]